MSSPNATPHGRSRENEPAPDNPLEDALWAALARVEDPELRRPITELGMVEYARVLAEEDDLQRHYAQVKVLLTIEGCPLKNTTTPKCARRLLPSPVSTACSLSLVP